MFGQTNDLTRSPVDFFRRAHNPPSGGFSSFRVRYDTGMKVHPKVFYALQFIVIALILGLVGVLGYFLLESDADKAAADAVRHAEILQLQTRADIYFARLQYYDGVCSAIGADAAHRCHESETAFAVETRLSDGSYYCADSTGFRGTTMDSKGEATACIP